MRWFLVLAAIVAVPGVVHAGDVASVFSSRVQPVLKAHCVECHNAKTQEGKVDLSGPRSLEQLATEPKLWFRVVGQLESGAMPPDGQAKLTPAERAAIVGWIRGELTGLLAARQLQEGRSKLRRLSRSEYANTIQDLFGVRPTVGLNLPEDGRVDGYDKVSAALPLSATGAAGYLKMTEQVLNRMLKPMPVKPADGTPQPVIHALARESGESAGHSLKLQDGTVVSFNSDTSSGGLVFSTRTPGIHRLRISAYGYQTDKPLPFGIYAGHTSAYPQVLDLLKVLEAPPGKAGIVEAEVYLRTGDLNDRTPVSDSIRLIPFGLGVQVPKNTQASKCQGPGLAVQWMDVAEPEAPLLGDRWLTADFPPTLNEELRKNKKAFFTTDKRKPYQAKSNREEFLATMAATFRRIGARFYRRDLTSVELSQIMSEITAQIDAEMPLEAVFFDQVTAMMTSPEFLCMIEPPGRLADFALASRLSFFLWNSAPDEQLLEVARQGRLHDPQVLRDETERLLADPKSDRFVNDFVGQWLGLRAIDDTSPDGKLYPEYAKNYLLKPSSVWETQAFLRRLLDEDLSVRHLVASPWTLMNEPLARHYGIEGIAGVELQKVNWPADSPYGGLWTQSSVLKVTANGTNTSPVKRGVWVVQRLLGTPIPPPPPNINPVEPDVRGAKTLREQLALHRGAGSCAACHARFDPYGFALESFDVTGHFRTHYRDVDSEVAALAAHQRKGKSTWRDGLPVDSSGETPAGQKFASIAELRQLLAAQPELLARGVTRHLLTYATGAPSSGLDEPAIDAMVSSAAGQDYGLRSLVHAVVQSGLFRHK